MGRSYPTESTFKIQRRMADWHFAKATTWAELLAVHDQWVFNLNYQVHWAHQERDDDRRTPRDVLAWYTGRPVTPEELHRLFYRTRFGRKLDKLGYVRFRHWRVYGERGLARERAAVWLYGETLTLEYADEPLAQYRVRYQPDKAHLRTVEAPLLFETPYQSPQLPSPVKNAVANASACRAIVGNRRCLCVKPSGNRASHHRGVHLPRQTGKTGGSIGPRAASPSFRAQ